MDTKDLDKLVEQIGEEILARLRPIQTAIRDVTTLPVPRPAGEWDRELAAMIDHTILKADATLDEVLKVCAEAKQYGFASVCVNGYWVPPVAKQLEGSPVKVCTVIGFPLGAASTDAKRSETETAVRVGAREVDMVLNIGALKSGDAEAVKLDIAAVADVAHSNGAILKVILETALLDDQQKVIACTLAKAAGADFVKTSTGFAATGASEADVRLMRSIVGPNLGVKASGGIRTNDDARRMIAAGANRIGASASVKIVEAGAA